MPAAAVASLTPGITGMSGTSVGARGEIVEDMEAHQAERNQERNRKALCITFVMRKGEGIVPSLRAKRSNPGISGQGQSDGVTTKAGLLRRFRPSGYGGQGRSSQ